MKKGTKHTAAGPVPAVKPDFEVKVERAREALAKDLPTLTCTEAIRLAAALKAIHLEGSLVFPVETFVCSALEGYGIHRLTPERAQDLVEMFTTEFEDMRSAAEEFLEIYGQAS